MERVVYASASPLRHLLTMNMKPNERLVSLDALRGFDMLFIMGFSGLVAAICALWPSAFTDGLAAQMKHVAWNGLSHHDTIFPLFLFIAGVSFPFSLAKQQAAGVSRKAIVMKILRRGITLVVLGMIYNGLFNLNFETLRVASVLGRIGIAWAVAALLCLFFGVRTRIAIAAAILIGYSLLLCLTVAPDAPAGADPLSVEGNIAGWFDRQWLPGRVLYKTYDPEGLLTTVPAVVSAMLGIFTGEFLREKRWSLSGDRKALYMFLAALALTAVGLLWSTVMPLNKKLWSSSFVCVVAGYSLAMLALFYYVADVRGHKRWTLFFRVIGLNSITIYLAQRIIDFGHISDFFLRGVQSLCSEQWAAVVSNAGYVAVCWIFLWILYKKDIFLKL